MQNMPRFLALAALLALAIPVFADDKAPKPADDKATKPAATAAKPAATPQAAAPKAAEATKAGDTTKAAHPAIAALLKSPDIEQLDPAKWPQVAPPASVPHGQTPLRVRVLVLDFNPLIPGKVYAPDKPDAPAKTLREVGGWGDSVELARGYMTDLAAASGGVVQFEIAEWLVVRRFQQKTDGFTYTPETYVASMKGGTRKGDAWHQPDGTDYPHMAEEFKLAELVDSGTIDEVWMMGNPYFGYWESCMLGPESFEVNGGVYDQIPCKRRFVVMGFNCERGVECMLEDNCHRTEATMSRVYGGWQSDKLDTNWARFAANEKQSGTAAVGTAHYPANGEHDYDYANPRMIESSADAWLNYPDLKDVKRTFNCEEWNTPYKNAKGAPDYHRNYMRWWFTHLPKAPGVNPDGRLNNWWDYIYNFNAYDAAGKALPGAKSPQPVDDKAGYRRPA